MNTIRSRKLELASVAVAYALLFWLLREQSYTGDWKNWSRFLDLGLWYRLREPLCLIVYQIPYALLKPFGVDAVDVLAGTSCVLGGLSMAYALESLRILSDRPRIQLLGMAALTTSYGVTGIFFGHVEHYSVMSFGCFVYVYYALRYAKGSATITAPALALGLLLTTHLMAVWLVPSLLALPWCRHGRAGAEHEHSAAIREAVRAACVVGVLNLATWIAIVALYYDGSIVAVFRDGASGSFTRARFGSVGNALGGGNRKGFLTGWEIFSFAHVRGLVALAFLYSPFLFAALAASGLHRPRERFRHLARLEGRLFLWMWVPYLVYVCTWEPGRGYVEDWDLFSHATIFGVWIALVLAVSAPWNRGFAAALAIGILLSATLTAFVVFESSNPETPSGVLRVVTGFGVSPEKLSKSTANRASLSAKRSRPPNVLLYVIDTLRADALSPYGNDRVDTPAIAKLAGDGVVYDRAYSASSWTRASMASLLSGLEPNVHGVEGRSDHLRSDVSLLSERFAAAGYMTACFTTNPNVGSYFGFDRGYDSFVELYDVKKERDPTGRVPPREMVTASDVVTRRAIEWIERSPEPFFALLHTVDPHSPYDPPAAYDKYARGEARAVDRATLHINRKDLTRAERERVRSLYLGEVSFNDSSFGKLMDFLRRTGRYDDTIVVFTSDHGEEFWEHGARGHGKNLFEESIHVPLIVRDPHSTDRGSRNDDPVRSVDLASMLVDLARLPRAVALPRAAPAQGAAGEPAPVRTQLNLDGFHTRAVIVYPWKLVADDVSGRQMLFQLVRDPAEREDLSDRHPEALAALTPLLPARERASRRTGNAPTGADDLRDLPQAEREALRVLGYIDEDEPQE